MNFLTKADVNAIVQNYQTPLYVYSEQKLLEAADNFLNFPSAFWHQVRYAMKANANKNILKLFNSKGLKIDASSEFEALRAIDAGFTPKDIQISWQETPNSLWKLLDAWVQFVATSLHQLEQVGNIRPNTHVWIRVNPGMGSWAFKAIATWWETSAFWIWHEYIPQIKEIAQQYNLTINKIHIHIGSENTPESWTTSANIGLDFVKQFEDVNCLDMWGWFKMAIMPYEQSADLSSIWEAVAKKFDEFYQDSGRKITLEVEPWKYMVINSCSVVARVDDIVDTWKNGYTFLRTNTGMTEMPRVPMYWVQQPITVVNDSQETQDYVVVWHCCESGDLLTCKLYDQEVIETVKLNKASIWDIIVIDGTGAYNASMSMKNYNSFPEAGEILMRTSGEVVEIRTRQKVEDIWKNEIDVL